jgi:hypothetical protein
MKALQLASLRKISLALILPGLAGLIVSAMISVHYLDTMPRGPSTQQLRTVPRNIHGIVVYQTLAENRTLNLFEYISIGVFLPGLALGLLYLEKWSSQKSRTLEEDEFLVGDYR